MSKDKNTRASEITVCAVSLLQVGPRKVSQVSFPLLCALWLFHSQTPSWAPISAHLCPFPVVARGSQSEHSHRAGGDVLLWKELGGSFKF